MENAAQIAQNKHTTDFRARESEIDRVRERESERESVCNAPLPKCTVNTKAISTVKLTSTKPQQTKQEKAERNGERLIKERERDRERE